MENESEITYDLTITNGSAKRLKSLIEHFEADETQVISLAVELLTLLKNAETVEFKNFGDAELRGINIPKKLGETLK